MAVAGWIKAVLGETETGTRLLREALATARAINSARAVAGSLLALAHIELVQGHAVTARHSCEEGLAIARQRGEADQVSFGLVALTRILIDEVTRPLPGWPRKN